MSIEAALILATFGGPVAAVVITLWHQDRHEARARKDRLFSTIMAHRRAMPVPREWVNALNMIDVVFADHADVLRRWHELYDYTHITPLDMSQWNNKMTAMLSEMATACGYKKLKQVDIDKYYSPIAHGTESQRSYEMQTELLRVLKNSERFSTPQRAPGTGAGAAPQTHQQ